MVARTLYTCQNHARNILASDGGVRKANGWASAQIAGHGAPWKKWERSSSHKIPLSSVVNPYLEIPPLLRGPEPRSSFLTSSRSGKSVPRLATPRWTGCLVEVLYQVPSFSLAANPALANLPCSYRSQVPSLKTWDPSFMSPVKNRSSRLRCALNA